MALTIPPLDYANAPTWQFVEARIVGANWWPTDEDQIASARLTAQLAINSSIDQFLRNVRWEPFISSGADEMRYYNKIDDQGRIMLGEGLLSLTSVSVLGVSYAVNDKAFLEPSNAAQKKKPFTSIQLWPSNYGYSETNYFHRFREMKPRSVVVTGKWGYSLLWPADAYEAIIGRAAAITLGSINQESELAGISEDGFNEAYDLVGPIDQKTALRESWGIYFDKVVAYYAGQRPRQGAQSLSTSPTQDRYNRSYLPLA